MEYAFSREVIPRSYFDKEKNTCKLQFENYEVMSTIITNYCIFSAKEYPDFLYTFPQIQLSVIL
jgi:hypothetical protein